MQFTLSNIPSALNAYKAASSKASGPGVVPQRASPSVSFDDYVADALASARDTLKTSEAVQIRGLRGEASTQEVVEAVMAAELTIQMVTSVRDRAVQAYQELMRMPV